jgi:hypothetical protein
LNFNASNVVQLERLLFLKVEGALWVEPRNSRVLQGGSSFALNILRLNFHCVAISVELPDLEKPEDSVVSKLDNAVANVRLCQLTILTNDKLNRKISW